MKKLVQFGAGNIGRSFIGQIFSRAGYEVVFVDVLRPLVEALNRERRYRIVIRQNDLPDEAIVVEPVRAVDGRDRAAVAAEAATAGLVATAVGKGALADILPAIADGIALRDRAGCAAPLDIILAENARHVSDEVRCLLRERLPADFPLEERVGLVESSIGKMVPLMKASDLAKDPLWIFAEPYNTLILDARGFRAGVPAAPGIQAVDNIRAYVDRKLFVHNLGHAAAAYLGCAADPGRKTVWEVLEDGTVLRAARAAMLQAADALLAEYPADFTRASLHEHIEDLLARFRNRALGDTVFRVGRDLHRKLHRGDRLVGAMLMAVRHALPVDAIARVFRAALGFRSADEEGFMLPGDRRFFERYGGGAIDAVLREVCELDAADPWDRRVIAAIRAGS